MAGYGLIEAVKENTDFKSDYAIAKELGIGRSNISTWKNTKSMPDAMTALKIAALAGLTSEQALKKLQGGYVSLSLTVMTATLSLAAVYNAKSLKTLYIMLN